MKSICLIILVQSADLGALENFLEDWKGTLFLSCNVEADMQEAFVEFAAEKEAAICFCSGEEIGDADLLVAASKFPTLFEGDVEVCKFYADEFGQSFLSECFGPASFNEFANKFLPNIAPGATISGCVIGQS